MGHLNPTETLERAERAIERGDIEEACTLLESYATWRAYDGNVPEGADDRFDALFGSLLRVPLPPSNCATPGAP